MTTSTQAIVVAAAVVAGMVAAVLIVQWLNRNAWRNPGEEGRTRVRWWAAAAALGLVAGIIVWRLGTNQLWPATAAALVLAGAGTPIAIIDTAVRRIPEPIILTAYALVGAALLVGAIITRQWGALGRATACGATLWAGFFLYALITSMGFGDVQLMGLAGLTLGWVGWWPGLMVAPIALLVGGLWATVLLVTGRRGTFAFAPPILVAALLTIAVLT